MTIICVPILICIVCVLFEKNFRYMEIFTIVICTVLHTIIFYYRFKTVQSSEDMTFGYFICFFERIVIERLPLFRHKAWFAIFITAVKMVIIEFDFASSLIFRACLTGFGLLLDYSKVNKERALHKDSFNSKQALKGLKELCKDHVMESLLIAKSDLQESLFANASFVKNYGEATATLKEILKQFKLEKEDLKKAAPRLIGEPMSYETRDQTQGLGNDVNLYTLLMSIQKLGLPVDGVWCDYVFTYSSREEVLQIKACPIVWKGQKALAIVINDLTEQYIIMHLKQINENKDKMVATVSHELRTPLNGILGMVQVLHKEIEEPELQRYLQTCSNSARLLLSLVNSILDLAQINNNKMKLNPEKYELADIMNDILALFDYQCKQKNLYLKLAIDEDVPEFITTDRNRLTQIVINLIANALKFTFEGGILISITLTSEDRITISVDDTGIGIKEEDLEKLFQAFGKLENTAKMNINGVGLGLSISDTLAKLLSGEEGSGLKVKSQENKGSTFFFTVHTDLKKLELEEKAKKIKKEKEVMMKEKRLKIMIPPQENSKNSKDIEQILGSDDSRIEIGQIDEGKGERKVRLSRQNTLMSQLKLDIPKLPRQQQQRLSQFRNSSSAVHSLHLDQSLSSPTSSLLKRGRTFLFSSKRDSVANGPLVLVVDDSPFNLMVAKELIEFHGCNVETALNGKLALDAVERRKEAGQRSFQLIFMDCEMPVMDGFEAMEALLEKMKQGEIEEIKIVALTANSIGSVKKKCLKAGMVECLGKPLLDQELKEILMKYIKQ